MAGISVKTGSKLQLGGSVSFDYNADLFPKKIKGTLRRIEVLAYDPTSNALIYGEAGAADDTFLLGGGGSQWLTQGGPANCVANLYYFDNSGKVQQYVQLASCSFYAEG